MATQQRSGPVPGLAAEPDLHTLAASAERWRAAGASATVVMGLGFVGAAVAAVLAGARRSDGRPGHFVIGLDLPTRGGAAKVAAVNAGRDPVASPDPEIGRLLAAGCVDGNLTATSNKDALGLADTVVVDIHLDVDDVAAEAGAISVPLDGFETAIRDIGARMRPDCLVVIESTVPPGATALAERALKDEWAKRGLTGTPLLGHAYERVMPGPRYADSIRRFWRTYSGVDAESRRRTRAFLESFTDVAAFPPTELADPVASELAKTLENSYRAANIALIHEWTLLAEKIGVNLFEVVDSIRVRRGTHDNMRYPGFGVGGYCLTKDALLAQWSAANVFGLDHQLAMTLEALKINRTMPLHSLDLARELCGGSLKDKTVALYGVAYMPAVADTRHSPAELFVAQAEREGARVAVQDPYLSVWRERPDLPLAASMAEAAQGADVLVFAVGHPEYKRLSASDPCFARARAVVDGWDVIGDALATELQARGVRLSGVGKGHWRKRGLHA